MESKTWEEVQEHLVKGSVERLGWEKEEHDRWKETRMLFENKHDRGDFPLNQDKEVCDDDHNEGC